MSNNATIASPGDNLPPHSIEAEQGVLACCLLDPDNCIGDAAEALGGGSNAFYDLRHQVVWRHLCKLYEVSRGASQSGLTSAATKGSGIDLIRLQQSLRDAGELESVGGLEYLASLPDKVPSAANLRYYLDIVREKQIVRGVIKACVNTVQDLYKTEDTAQTLAESEREMASAFEQRVPTNALDAKECVQLVITNVIDKFRRGRKFHVGPALGFNYLDNIVPGLRAGDLVILAARPSTGKSAMMMQIVEHIASNEKSAVGVMTLEMTAQSLMLRNLFQHAGADLTKFCNGFHSDADAEPLAKSALELSGLPIYIDESPRLSIEDLEVKARRLARRQGIKVLFVDYFQLLYVRQSRRQWSKSDELAEVSMRLKALAKELGIPIFVCAQMNRQIEQDTHRRPRLSDLKDTGQLEQDADLVMFLWKPDVKSESWEKKLEQILPRVPCPADWRSMEKGAKNWRNWLTMVTCTVEKQREGRSHEDALMVFIRPWTRFVDAYRPDGTAPKAGKPTQAAMTYEAEQDAAHDDGPPEEQD